MTIGNVKPATRCEPTARKVQAIEDLWNTCDPERVVLAYALDSIWQDRSEILCGWDEIKNYLRREWATKFDFRVRKELWAAGGNRTAVYVESEWQDGKGRWYRSQGVEFWEFDENGLIARRINSVHEKPIHENQRRIL